MGCGCAKKKPTPSSPAVFGAPEGPVLEVVPSVRLQGLEPNEHTWVQGTHVQTMLDAGWLRLA